MRIMKGRFIKTRITKENSKIITKMKRPLLPNKWLKKSELSNQYVKLPKKEDELILNRHLGMYRYPDKCQVIDGLLKLIKSLK